MRPVRRRRCDRARVRQCAMQRSAVVAAMVDSGGEIGVYSAQSASGRRRCAGLCKWRWPWPGRQVALRIVLNRVYSRSHSAMWSGRVRDARVSVESIAVVYYKSMRRPTLDSLVMFKLIAGSRNCGRDDSKVRCQNGDADDGKCQVPDRLD
jgi:hypothetical protein